MGFLSFDQISNETERNIALSFRILALSWAFGGAMFGFLMLSMAVNWVVDMWRSCP